MWIISMPKFSATSELRLSGCHSDLIKLMNAAIQDFDFAVICGHRNQQDQDAAYNAGKSKLKYPHSKHNTKPSIAVDIAPIKYNENGTTWVDWDDLASFFALSKIVQKHADNLDIKIRWGGDWDGNPLTRNLFNDYPHFELETE